MVHPVGLNHDPLVTTAPCNPLRVADDLYIKGSSVLMYGRSGLII